MRDLACVKWFLRTSGHDTYDDFELLVQVHEVSYESRRQGKSFVRLSAGHHVIATAKNKKGLFQEVLSVLVEQGTQYLVVDLLTDSGALLANLKLDILRDVLQTEGSHTPSKVYHMNQKERGVLNPTVTLTLFPGGAEEDMEGGLLEGEDMETALLMRQHLSMAQQSVKAKPSGSMGIQQSLRGVVSDASQGDVEVLDVLVRACCGTVDVFQGFGGADKRYISIVGPPVSRRFTLGIWKDEQELEAGKPAEKEVDVLKIQSVQGDPGRADVFHLSFYDNAHLSKKITCRITDRPTKVWVETLTLLITRIHSLNNNWKKERSDRKNEADPKKKIQGKSLGKTASLATPPTRGGGMLGAMSSLKSTLSMKR